MLFTLCSVFLTSSVWLIQREILELLACLLSRIISIVEVIHSCVVDNVVIVDDTIVILRSICFFKLIVLLSYVMLELVILKVMSLSSLLSVLRCSNIINKLLISWSEWLLKRALILLNFWHLITFAIFGTAHFRLHPIDYKITEIIWVKCFTE